MKRILPITLIFLALALTAHASPATDYKGYLQSLENENIGELKKYLINSEKKKYSSNQITKILEENITYSKMAIPQNLEILKESITGVQATIEVRGKFHEQDSIGIITMIQENGIWKILKQDWKSN